MKICFHTNFEISQKYIGGTERFLVKVGKELEVLGHEIIIVCSSLEEETMVEGIRVLGRIPLKKRKAFERYSYFSSSFIKNEIIGTNYSIDSLKRLSEYTSDQIFGINADVFHLNSFASASYLSPGSNYLVTNHENEFEYDSYWGVGFFDLLCKEANKKNTELHKYKALITPSKYYAKLYSQKLGLEVKGINLGVHLKDFQIKGHDQYIKDTYFSGSKGTIILFPSRFQTKQKGHDIAIKACSILKSQGYLFKVIFTGVKKSSEKYIPDFMKLVEEYGLLNYIQITSFSDIRKAYNNCDIVISPEKYCSYGLSISESLALGIPTILSDIPTYREIARGFNHAIFFKNESPEDMAVKLASVISKRMNRNRSEAIRFRIRFDLRKCAIKYHNLYDQNLQ